LYKKPYLERFAIRKMTAKVYAIQHRPSNWRFSSNHVYLAPFPREYLFSVRERWM